uniref:Uncharacterized protein n=1 Tax=Panagrolaimus davidi TaxID=227884 RepID=A0A914Q1A1_9BILA
MFVFESTETAVSGRAFENMAPEEEESERARDEHVDDEDMADAMERSMDALRLNGKILFKKLTKNSKMKITKTYF